MAANSGGKFDRFVDAVAKGIGDVRDDIYAQYVATFYGNGQVYQSYLTRSEPSEHEAQNWIEQLKENAPEKAPEPSREQERGRE